MRTPPAGEEGAASLTVAQLGQRINRALRDGLPRRVRVRGEVSGFKAQSHWFFTLKDDEAVVLCVMFASAVRRQDVEPEDGMEVIATGRVEHWSVGGRTQLYVEHVEPIGAGALELRFRALCDELRRLGWFDPDEKRRTPLVPRRIAVVTSRTGAALEDVLDTARRRCPAVEILVVDVRVQGAAAAPQIAAALHEVGRRAERLGVDAVLLTRGGGSIEDLWAFNERSVAEAVRGCAVPVVAAIGHETDTTIAELVADVRCATPTQAAMHLVPDRSALAEQLDLLAARLAARVRRQLDSGRETLRLLGARPALRSPRRAIELTAERLDARHATLRRALHERLRRERDSATSIATRLATGGRLLAIALRGRALHEIERRLRRATRQRVRGEIAVDAGPRLLAAAGGDLARRRERLTRDARALELVGPARVLARGYSITLGPKGVVRDSGELRRGDRLETRLAVGRVRSVVEDDAARARRPRRGGPPKSSGGLFD